MPLDPNISLEGYGSQGGGGGNIPLAGNSAGAGNGNFLGQFGQLAGVAQQMNQLKLFQQQFGARQRAGEIIAQSPDMDSAMQGIQKSGDAAFLLPELQYMREMQKTQTDITGQQLGQNQTALQAVMKATVSANSPADFDKALQTQMQSLPPDVLKRNLPAIMSYRNSILDGVNSQSDFDKNRLARATGAGMTMDSIHQMFGTPTEVQLGNRVALGNVNPITGGMNQASSLGVGSAPHWGDVGGTPTPFPALGAGASGAPRAGNGGSAAASPSPPSTLPPSYSGRPNPLLGGLPNPDESPAPVSSLGREMKIGQTSVAPQGRGAGLLGLNVMSIPQLQTSQELIKDFTGKDKEIYDNAVNMKGNLETLDKSYDNLIAGGGSFVQPGALADARLSVGKLVNTFSQLTGITPPIDPSKLATAEDFQKVAGVLSQAATKSAFGGSHMAAETINGVMKTVPQLENTYLGGKLLIAGLNASADRIADQRKFESAWMEKNQGALGPSTKAEFDKQFPPQEYANKVLDQFGMTANGFKSPQDLGNAVANGWLTKEQARGIWQSQFAGKGQ